MGPQGRLRVASREETANEEARKSTRPKHKRHKDSRAAFKWSHLQKIFFILLLHAWSLSVQTDGQSATSSDNSTTGNTGRHIGPLQVGATSSVSLVSGRQRRPLSVEEENAISGGFIMRALASAAGSGAPAGSSSPKERGATGEWAGEAESQFEASSVNATREADGQTAVGGGQGQQGESAGDEEEEGRIAIDRNRKLYATHDQLLIGGGGGASKEEQASSKQAASSSGAVNRDSNSPQQQQQQSASRTGMARLAYASSFLSGK